jgi:hypothetical protein
MNPREWFVLGIRLFGLWSLTRGAGYLASFVDLRMGLNEMLPGAGAKTYLFHAACEFAIAAYFLFGARHLAGICEGHDNRDDKDQDQDQDEDREGAS